MRISPILYNTSASFRGKYKEQIDKSLPDSYKPHIERIRPRMEEAASINGDYATLYLTGCADGLRIGYREKFDFSPYSDGVLESKETIKFSKPMNIRKDSFGYEYLYPLFEDVLSEIVGGYTREIDLMDDD